MLSNDIKISIIMPVYNVAEYLPKAIDSVLNQSHKNIELFLVDDGSTDSSGMICDEYASKNLCVNVIHPKKRQTMVILLKL